jgi:hypothetical protein
MSLKTIVLSEKSRSDGLHVETPLGIVNIRHKLGNRNQRVVSVEISPNSYVDEPAVRLDGFTNNRLVEQ